jgi:hypothetical protein
VLLLDDQVPSPGSDNWRAPSLQFVIRNCLPRRGTVVPGWTSSPLEWTHANCGGVTGTSGVLQCVGRSDNKLTHPKMPRRQLSSMLSTAKGGRSMLPPTQQLGLLV